MYNSPMRLQKKYFLTFAILFLVLTIAMSLAAYLTSRAMLVSKYKELSRENLSYLLDITEKEMDEMDGNFDFISASDQLAKRMETTYASADSYERMQDDIALTELISHLSVDDTFDAISLIYIAGDQEDYWYGAGRRQIDTFAIEEVFTKQVKENGNLYYLGIGPSLDHVQRHVTMLRFARVLVDVDRQEIGKVYFELDAGYFNRLYSSDRKLTHTSLYLLDSQDYLLYSEESELTGLRYTEMFPEDSIQVRDSLQVLEWDLIGVTPGSYVAPDSSLILRYMLTIALVSSLLAFGAIAIITNRFVRPIRSLSDAMTEVQQGDYSVSVHLDSKDEIGELTEQFNHMTGRIQEHLDREIAYTKAMNDAEYKALQAQINPHFMYNSLNTLKWIANLQKADNITKMVDALWILLKRTSSFKGQIIKLENEIEVIQAFTVILQARYNGKFSLVYAMDQTHMEWPVPKYILQPLVENAIFHGIEPKEGQGVITLESRVEGEELIIRVIDDGVGMSEDRMVQILRDENAVKGKTGLNNIGVKNVHDRLGLLYGKGYGLEIESKIGEGTVFTVRIPKGGESLQ